MCHRFEMMERTAVSSTTRMLDLEAFWYWPELGSPRRNMRSCPAMESIPVLVQFASPQLAAKHRIDLDVVVAQHTLPLLIHASIMSSASDHLRDATW
jgi:hypothetical protein